MKDGKLNQRELKHYVNMLENLPRTADNIPIYPLMPIYFWDDDKDQVVRTTACSVSKLYKPVYFDVYDVDKSYKEVKPSPTAEWSNWDLRGDTYKNRQDNVYLDSEQVYYSTANLAKKDGLRRAEALVAKLTGKVKDMKKKK